MAGFDNDVVYANNGDFSVVGAGGGSAANGLQTDGQFWIGRTVVNVGGTHISVGTITSPLGTLSIGYSAPNITIDAVGGGVSIDSVAMQTGTTPVVPDGAGLVTFNGARVAAGTNPVRTNGTGANTMQLEVQTSQAIAATNVNNVGLAAFDSAAFDVDANGFVQLNGGGIAATSFDVQANTAPGTDPVVPTAAGVVAVNGAVVANHSVVLESRSRAANAYNLEVQYATSAAATDGTKSGVAHFDLAMFTVDASGFVALAGGGQAIDSIGTQTGTNPITPTAAGLVTINGATVAAGTNPVRSDGTGANTMAIEVQISQAIAATDATKIGLCNFDSGSFSVDANGFVTLRGGTEAIDSIGVDATSGTGTNPVLPTTAGLVTVNGATVAASTTPVRSVSTAPNVYQIQIQTSQAIASTNATNIGLSAFDSTSFTVDANGFVQSKGGGFTWNDVSGAFSPLKNNGYFITATATGTLPAAPSQGDTIKFFVDTTQLLTIQATAGKIIRMGTLVSSSGGTFVSTLQGDSCELVYRSSDSCWCTIAGFTGTWTLT